jgi:hypothetical protein
MRVTRLCEPLDSLHLDALAVGEVHVDVRRAGHGLERVSAGYNGVSTRLIVEPVEGSAMLGSRGSLGVR